ncbi:solute carrier family 41 member 2-like [Salmo trutta]|uniref:solute carrier family 41 member 2-like n=1 Tax=Salmo trutta TaxID=8032 RepID=UPI001131106B|nr:solute carrier family 41 member 2-like [Salmo trutta]
MIVVGVIIGSKRIGINPDNVATPIAASFSDLITLACLSQGHLNAESIIPMCLICLCLTHLWVVVSFRNPASCILLYTGWEPIITAMVISRSATLFRAPEVQSQHSNLVNFMEIPCFNVFFSLVSEDST